MSRSTLKNPTKKFHNTSEYEFNIGQAVQLKRKTKTSDREIFYITGMLPLKENSPQYRIKNKSEEYERVTTQELIEAAGPNLSTEIEMKSSPAFRKITKIAVPSRRGNVTIRTRR